MVHVPTSQYSPLGKSRGRGISSTDAAGAEILINSCVPLNVSA
jgi:hypothetical protein